MTFRGPWPLTEPGPFRTGEGHPLTHRLAPGYSGADCPDSNTKSLKTQLPSGVRTCLLMAKQWRQGGPGAGPADGPCPRGVGVGAASQTRGTQVWPSSPPSPAGTRSRTWRLSLIHI